MVRTLVGSDNKSIVDARFATTVNRAGQPFLVSDALNFSEVKDTPLYIVDVFSWALKLVKTEHFIRLYLQ